MAAVMKNRYWLLGLLVIVSAIPQVLVLPLLGSTNLLFLILLWVLLAIAVLYGRKAIRLATAFLFAIAMAVPPAPNYLWPTNTGVLRFQFIGWANVFHALYGTIFFFVFYLALFLLAAVYVRRSEA